MESKPIMLCGTRYNPYEVVTISVMPDGTKILQLTENDGTVIGTKELSSIVNEMHCEQLSDPIAVGLKQTADMLQAKLCRPEDTHKEEGR